jgi:hypothetical protein
MKRIGAEDWTTHPVFLAKQETVARMIEWEFVTGLVPQ